MDTKIIIFLAILLNYMLEINAACLPIADGGTNSATALATNKMMVSSADKIVEAAALVTTNGANLLIGDPSVSTSRQRTEKLMIQGVANDLTDASHTFYTTEDGAPTMAFVNADHSRLSICFDAYNLYGDTHYRSASSTSNFCMEKGTNFAIKYGSGFVPGFSATLSNALVIDTSGYVTTNDLTANTVVVTNNIANGGVGLTYYKEAAYTVSISGAFSSASVPVKANRLGRRVTLTFPPVTGSVIVPAPVYIDLYGVVSSDFYPTANYSTWSVIVSDGSDAINSLIWYGSGSMAKFKLLGLQSSVNFGIGTGRGYAKEFSISFVKY